MSSTIGIVTFSAIAVAVAVTLYTLDQKRRNAPGFQESLRKKRREEKKRRRQLEQSKREQQPTIPKNDMGKEMETMIGNCVNQGMQLIRTASGDAAMMEKGIEFLMDAVRIAVPLQKHEEVASTLIKLLHTTGQPEGAKMLAAKLTTAQ
eukprot:m.7195 g.7195  ORF g.7195 m.7195 type:complete len:149 (+) comp3664_c0_seq1:184-630(+)